MLRKFKITYWLDGDTRVKEILATSKYNAKIRFYLTDKADDIISIVEVSE
jgi:hypothetical protein